MIYRLSHILTYPSITHNDIQGVSLGDISINTRTYCFTGCYAVSRFDHPPQNYTPGVSSYWILAPRNIDTLLWMVCHWMTLNPHKSSDTAIGYSTGPHHAWSPLTHSVVPGVSLILISRNAIHPYLLCDKWHLALHNIQEEATVAYLQLLQPNSSGDSPNKSSNPAHFKKDIRHVECIQCAQTTRKPIFTDHRVK